MCDKCDKHHNCFNPMNYDDERGQSISYKIDEYSKYHEKLKINYQKAKEFVSSYFPQLKEQFLREEKNAEKIKQFNEEYDKALTICNDIFEFIQIIIKNYQKDSGEILTTCSLLYLISGYKLIEGGNSDSFINYLKHFSLFQLKEDQIISAGISTQCGFNAVSVLHNGNIITGGDRKLFTFDVKNNYNYKVYEVDNYCSTIDQFDNDIIVTTVRNICCLYSPDDYHLIHSFAVSCEVSKVLSGNRIAIVDNKEKNTITIYDCSDPQKEQKINTIVVPERLGNSFINLIYNREKEILISTDYYGYIFDMVNYQMIKKIDDIPLIFLDNERLLARNSNGFMIYNYEKNEKEKVFEVENKMDGYSAMLLRDKVSVLILAKYGELYMLNTKTGEVIIKKLPVSLDQSIMKINDSSFIAFSYEMAVYKY